MLPEQQVGLDRDELLQAVSHELRSPLSSIYTYADILLADEGIATNDQSRHDVQQIQVSAQRLLADMDAILELVRVEALILQPASIDLSVVVEEALENARHIAQEAGRPISYEKASDLPLVEIDATHIAQVIKTLLSHQIKFLEHDTIHILAWRRADSVIVTIGGGDLQAEEHTIATLPLNHIKGVLGIELLICIRLVNLHGGKLWASQQNGGTISMSFSLPV